MEISIKPLGTVTQELLRYLTLRYEHKVPLNLDTLDQRFSTKQDVALTLSEAFVERHRFIEAYGIVVNNDYDLMFKPLNVNNHYSLAELFGLVKHFGSDKMIDIINEALNTTFESMYTISQFIIESDSIQVEDKYRLNLLMHDREIVEVVYARTMDHYTTLIAQLDQQLPAVNTAFEKTIDKQKMIDVVAGFFPQIKKIPTVLLTPSFLFHDRLTINHTPAQKEVQIVVSDIMLELEQLETNLEATEKRFQDGLKVLGETTKFEILKRCLEETKYGAQLAEELNISGATVSHHMQALLNLSYVTVEIINKRAYYQTNIEKVREDLALFDQIFTQN